MTLSFLLLVHWKAIKECVHFTDEVILVEPCDSNTGEANLHKITSKQHQNEQKEERRRGRKEKNHTIIQTIFLPSFLKAQFHHIEPQYVCQRMSIC